MNDESLLLIAAQSTETLIAYYKAIGFTKTQALQKIKELRKEAGISDEE